MLQELRVEGPTGGFRSTRGPTSSGLEKWQFSAVGLTGLTSFIRRGIRDRSVAYITTRKITHMVKLCNTRAHKGIWVGPGWTYLREPQKTAVFRVRFRMDLGWTGGSRHDPRR